jgi:uncharacterized membrane protein YfcA
LSVVLGVHGQFKEKKKCADRKYYFCEMEYAFILAVALVGSGLSFISGFGFGTMLLPVMALFFDLPTAVFATAIVHFLNNFFKLTLVGRHAHWKTVIQFGIPSAVGAFLGAEALNYLANLQQPIHVKFWIIETNTTFIGVVMGFVLILLAIMEYSNALVRVNKAPRILWLGGVFSGFFGGLSGQQGAIRSAFLMNHFEDKQVFIGTRAALAFIVDTVRIFTYAASFHLFLQHEIYVPMALALIGGMSGALIGNKFLQKTSIEWIRKTVMVFLFVMGTLMIAGLV